MRAREGGQAPEVADMEEMVIHGGRPLRGTVHVHGAKNAALPIMAASLLVDGPTILHGVPRLLDVSTMMEVLAGLDVPCEWTGPSSLRLGPAVGSTTAAPPEPVRGMRASICVLGPLLAARGAAGLPMPGGCVIGDRPIDLHLKGLRALGAGIEEGEDSVCGTSDGLRGARIHLSGPRGSTALGTANVMMAACLAAGRTVIMGAAREPEIQDLAAYLTACGARISGAGTGMLTIDGVERLRGCEHTMIPDRIEAGTFLAAAAATGGEVTVEGACAGHMEACLNAMESMGVDVTREAGSVRAARRGPLRPISLATAPHPGFPTDMQPQLSVLMCLAGGTSAVHEDVYPVRFTHAPGLSRMGARIARGESQAVIEGVESLQGADVHAEDLRGGAALVVAGLAAEGTTTLRGLHHLDRGYHDLERRLRDLGALVERRPVVAAEERRRSA